MPATPWLLYVGLGVVAWGLFVPDQGLWNDDVQNLFRAFVARERGEGLFPAIATPTRRLLALPSIAALASGWPVQALHLLSSVAWLAAGLLAHHLCGRLWPDQPLAAALAGALTLCATPDFLTGAPLAIGYQLSTVYYLCAVLLGLVWLQRGSRAALWATPLALSASLWTTDAAVGVWLLTPLLWAAAPGVQRRRVLPLGLLWFLAPVPYFVVVAGQWAAGGGYLHQAQVRLGVGRWIARFADLLAWNFTPWRWALGRPLWFPAAGAVVPWPLRWTIALLAGAVAAWAILRRAPGSDATARPGVRRALAALALMAAANAPFAGLQYAEFYWRTHLLSRVFAALALAWPIALAWSRARGPLRGVVAGAVALWLSLGVAGALERQDYWVGYTRAHRQELSSILAAVPALSSEALLLVRVPAHGHLLATETAYHTRAWIALLNEDSSLECRTVQWAETRPTACVSALDGFVCRGERSPECQRRDGRDEQLLPFERLVVLDYQPLENRYVLAPTLPAVTPGAARYEPHAQLRPRPRTRLASALLDHNRGLAAWLWP